MTEKQDICECGHDEARHFFNKDKSCDVKYCGCKKFKKRQGKGIIEEVLNWTLENLSGSYSKKNEKVLRDAFEVVVNETCKKFALKKQKMNFDERIQNLTQQINIASREVIIQDRMLGQSRERVAELQGRLNMLMEMQRAKDINQEPALAGKSKKPIKKK